MVKEKKEVRSGEWSENEIQLLMEIFPNSRTLDVAKRLARSIGSVKKKAGKLEIRKTEEHRKRLVVENRKWWALKKKQRK